MNPLLARSYELRLPESAPKSKLGFSITQAERLGIPPTPRCLRFCYTESTEDFEADGVLQTARLLRLVPEGRSRRSRPSERPRRACLNPLSSIYLRWRT